MTPTERTRKWRKDNPKRYKMLAHSLYLKNRDRLIKQVKEYRLDKPWYRSYKNAHRRCKDINSKFYKNYGGKGIKLLMKPKDFEYLWKRDKAYLMIKPSIDRINPEGNYELLNCRYLELKENILRRRNING